MAGDRTIFMLHGFGTLFLVVATISLMASIFTNYWIVSSVGGSGFQSAGLWKACFSQYTVNNERFDALGLSGCYSFSDPVFDDYQDWIHPSWLKGAKGLLVTSMFLNVACLFCCAFYLLQQNDSVLVPIVIITWVSLMASSAGTTLYRFSAFDRDWLPLPDSNYLSSSFNAAAAAVLLLLVSSSLHGVLGLILWCQRSRSMSKY